MPGVPKPLGSGDRRSERQCAPSASTGRASFESGGHSVAWAAPTGLYGIGSQQGLALTGPRVCPGCHLLQLAFPSHPHPQGPLRPVIPYLCPELSLLHSFIPQIFIHRLQRARPSGGKLTVKQTEAKVPVFGAPLSPVGDRPWQRMTQLPQRFEVLPGRHGVLQPEGRLAWSRAGADFHGRYRRSPEGPEGQTAL